MNKKLYIFLLIFFLLLMLISFSYILKWSNDNRKVSKIQKEEEKFLDIDSLKLDKQLFKDNKYTIGWIIVKGTNINYPVVKYNDNNFYLNHDFKKEYNDAGWIFMDYRNSLEDQNIVIYGHHRHDNSMFGDIDKLFNKDFYKENNEILLITEKEVITYKIFSVYSINSNDKYINNNFKDFNNEINKFINRSEISLDKAIKTDQIITLSTCHSNNRDRLVVHGCKK